MRRILGTNHARFSILVSDACQGMGIGKELLRRLIDMARQEKLECIEFLMTPDNKVMKKMCSEFGCCFSEAEQGMIKAEISLK